MTTDQLLRGRQSKAGAFGSAGDQRIEDRVLQIGGYARSVILNFDRGDDAMSYVADREVRYGAAAQREGAMAIQRRDRITHKVQECLDHLVPVKIDQRQPRIVIAVHGQLFLILCLDNAHDVFEQFVNVGWLLVGRAARSEQRIDECGQPVGFADDDVRVFSSARVVELPLQAVALRRECRRADSLFHARAAESFVGLRHAESSVRFRG